MKMGTPGVSRARLLAITVFGAVLVAALVGVLTLGDGSSTASASSGAAKTKGTIGALILVEADEQGVRTLKAIQKQGAAMGYKVVDIDAKYDPTKEIAGMDTFINEKVNGIITFATDNQLLKSKIAAAHKAGIPVIAITGGKPVPGLTWSLDMPEETYSYALATKLFKAILNSKRDHTAVEMVLPEAVPCRRREAAFEKAAKNFPQITLSKYHIDGNNAVSSANSYFSTYLAAHRNLGGVVSCWDIPLTGTLTAAQSLGISKDFIAMGINGSSDSIARMQNHQPYLQVDVGIALAAAGRDTVVQMANVLQGKPTTIPKSRYSTVRWGFITPSNLPPKGQIELLSWLPKGWNPNYWK